MAALWEGRVSRARDIASSRVRVYEVLAGKTMRKAVM
jgi:hypothetical protein